VYFLCKNVVVVDENACIGSLECGVIEWEIMEEYDL